MFWGPHASEFSMAYTSWKDSFSNIIYIHIQSSYTWCSYLLMLHHLTTLDSVKIWKISLLEYMFSYIYLLYVCMYVCMYHSCQNVNRIMNRFLIFSYHVSYHIVYRKIHNYLIKFIKNYKYTYIKGIFIINFECIQTND